MDSTKNVKLFAYDLCTPKFTGNGYDADRYDHDQMDFFFSQVLKQREHKRAFLHDGKMLNLVSYGTSDDADYVEGIFASARFGQVQDIINVFNQVTTGKKEINEGVKNEVSFILHKNSGLLLVQYDEQHVVSRDMLKKYFNHHQDLMESYKQEFKRINAPLIIPKYSIQLKTLPSREFFQEINELTTIKEAFVLADLDKGANNEAIEFLRNEAREEDVGGFHQIKITLQNKVKSTGISHIEAYFRKLIELEAYDGYGVVGYTRTGKPKTVTFAHIPYSQDVNVSINSNGLLNQVELISEMIRVAKIDNPLLRKNDGIDPLNKVVVGEEDDEKEGIADQATEAIS